MKIWHLKKGADRRMRQGHPWAFASELAHSAKEVRAGEVVELRDAADKFLAFGYASPRSQICFRRLSSRSKDKDVFSRAFFVERLKKARDLRDSAGWSSASHRWIYGEADGVPGLIVDVFLSPEGQRTLVVQSSTAGVESALPEFYSALDEFGSFGVIESPTSSRRRLEGLEIGERRVVRGEVLSKKLVLQHGLTLECDLIGGQKTGFFLDQQWNAGLMRRLLAAGSPGRRLRVLDICCYVGQWGAHAAHALGGAEVTLVDVSMPALELAEANVRAAGGDAEVICGDALGVLAELPEGQFDVVICDPPAFVKKKNDLAQGLQAYVKLNRDALRRVAPGGLLVTCSCSGLVRSEDWHSVLQQAGGKSGRMFQILARGGHGPDHPVRPEFPEGEYLKCALGRIDYPY